MRGLRTYYAETVFEFRPGVRLGFCGAFAIISTMGRLLINTGILLVVIGLVVILGERFGIRFGRLPGDIRIEGRHGGFYFPIVTCLLISAVLSLIAWLFNRRG